MRFIQFMNNEMADKFKSATFIIGTVDGQNCHTNYCIYMMTF